MTAKLRGELRIPGDKSISHRALIFAAMAEGESQLENLADGDDVRSTWSCLRKLGVPIRSTPGQVYVGGLGWRGLREPKRDLDAGNSGTTMRLLMGLIAGQDMWANITGDDSLKRRPMERVAAPLRRMGATIELTGKGTAPVAVRGATLRGIDYVSPVASAQVKSAVLIAGLLALGDTSVTEPQLSRDHTERLLPCFGGPVTRRGLKVTVRGGLHLGRARVEIPGDASSAAFWAVGAAISPGSCVRLKQVGLNPTRTRFLEALAAMGAKVKLELDKGQAYEPVGDVVVEASSLSAVDVAAEDAPRLIDEVPALAVAASQAKGTSRFRGLSELRHKESDRLAGIAEMLNALGGRARVEGDELVVEGGRALAGGRVATRSDHRIAMAAKIAELVCAKPVALDDDECVAISYRTFFDHLRRLRG